MNKNIFTRKAAVFLAVLFLSLLVHVSAGGSEEINPSLRSVQQEEEAPKAMSLETEAEADIPESKNPAAEQEQGAGDSSSETDSSLETETSSAYEDPHEGETESRNTESQTTESQSKDSQSTESQSKELQSTDSQSTKSQTTESQATSTDENQLQETKKTHEETQTDALSEEDLSESEIEDEMADEIDDGMDGETASETERESETEEKSETLSKCTCDSIEKNILAHSWDCQAFQERFQETCDCIFSGYDHVWEHDYFCHGILEMNRALCTPDCGVEAYPVVFHYECYVLQRYREALCSCNTEEDVPNVHRETCSYYQYLHEAFETIHQPAVTAETFGTKLPGTGLGFQALSGNTPISADYPSIRFYSNHSSLQTFGTSVKNKMQLYKTVNGEGGAQTGYAWYPQAASVINQHGVIYRKVLYSDGRWYDLKFTIAGYTKSVKASDGSMHTRYPYAGFHFGKITLFFYRGGYYILKGEILDSVTQAKTKKKFRLNFRDVDDYQLVGVKAGSGSTVDARYVRSDNILYYDPSVTIANMAGMERIMGGNETITDLRGDVIYDFNGSEFYIAIGYGDNDTVSWSTIKDRPVLFDDGTANQSLSSNYAIIGIRGVSSLAPVEIPTPNKQVSNTNTNWGASNTLSKIDDAYWYRVEQYVPDEISTYYYSKFVFTDALPTGAKYVENSLTVKRVETGETLNISNQFSFSATDGKLVLTAKDSLLKTAAFYGCHYEITFKVRLDREKITPKLQGSKATYTVSNQATITARHKTESSDTLRTSNTVTTVGSEIRPDLAAPAVIHIIKEIDAQDIVWAHGNPVFVFRVAGTDTAGNPHVYYEAVEFTEKQQADGEKIRAIATLQVLEGTYQVTEERTMRYALAKVYDVQNGSLSGQGALFSLASGESGSVVFYNTKTTDEGQSHTSFVRNTIKK